jgi:NADH dehydrogenase [ubiquinone] 1 alpha subcomplex assembly factor 7
VPGELAALVAERARRLGPLPYDEVLELALYHPVHGFYSSGRGAGRGRDFLTSPEVGPLFAAVVARALDEWWAELGRPDPFVVVEAGAGSGALAAAVLGARPACSPALRYVLVERSDAVRRLQAARVPLEPAAFVLGPVLLPDPDVGPRPRPGSGPLATALAELPVGPFDGVILANELLDNLPFRLLQNAGHAWSEVRVGHDLAEVLVPASPEVAAEGDRLAPGAPAGGRIPIQRQGAAWLRAAMEALHRGRIVVVDYADTTPAFARRPWTEWVRTYRAHGRGGHPLADLGAQDVTCEVASDQLAAVRPAVCDRSQAQFLEVHGLGELVEDARRRWQERAAVGDLAAVAARSRVTEGSALADPSGLGSFRVLEWVVG